MLRPICTLTLTTLFASLTMIACGDDKGTTTTDETGAQQTTGPGTTAPTTTDATTAGDTPAGTTAEPDTTTTGDESTGPVGETAADGEACKANGDCQSLGCEKYRDLDEGTCVAAPAGGATRFMGTVIDFITLEPVASTDLRVLEALTALQNPVEGAALVKATSDADGKLDVTSADPIGAAFGVVGVIQGASYYPTATGLAAPLSGQMYGPMNGNHDIWAVPSAKLTEWSDILSKDPDFMIADPDKAVLPLGEAGGVVGFVRDSTKGAGVAGAKVVGANGATSATIRYLSEDGTGFTSDATSSNGLFVLVNPGLAEQFSVEGSDAVGSAGSAKGAAFVLILTVD